MFLGRYIMTGVKQCSFGAGSFCNTVCYLVIGKLDIEYGANLFRFDLIGQKSNRRSAGFCLIAASWKGGKTVQTVFFRKITEGKTVAEYHCFMGNACKKIAEILVQCLQFGNIGVCIFLINFCIFRIDTAQCLFNCPGNQDGVLRRSPNMLIIFHFMRMR